MTVDGEPVDLADTLTFKSFMLSGIPNFAFAVGYTNSSWTLKVDLVCEHLCRLLSYMDVHGCDTVVPVADDPTVDPPAAARLPRRVRPAHRSICSPSRARTDHGRSR